MNKFLALSLCFAVSAMAQIQSFGSLGKIDWNEREVVAKGIGAPSPNMPGPAARPMAIQAARKTALRNALEIIKGIQLDSKTTVADMMLTSDEVTTTVSGYVNNFSESDPKYMADKTIEITVTVPLNDEMLEVLFVKEISSPSTADYQKYEGDELEHTGLVVVVNPKKFKASVVPKILTEEKEEVFGPAFLDRKSAILNGAAKYSTSISDAQKETKRVGNNPLIVNAVAYKNAGKDIVVSVEDGNKIKASAKANNFMKDGMIVIVSSME
jgi:hypothetical protein